MTKPEREQRETAIHMDPTANTTTKNQDGGVFSTTPEPEPLDMVKSPPLTVSSSLKAFLFNKINILLIFIPLGFLAEGLHWPDGVRTSCSR